MEEETVLSAEERLGNVKKKMDKIYADCLRLRRRHDLTEYGEGTLDTCLILKEAIRGKGTERPPYEKIRGNRRAGKGCFNDHREIILTALRDYRKWFDAKWGEGDVESIKPIDAAIAFMEAVE